MPRDRRQRLCGPQASAGFAAKGRHKSARIRPQASTACQHSLGGYFLCIMYIDLSSHFQDTIDLYQKRVVFFKGDIRSYEDVLAAMDGVDVVFHAASFGLSGAEMLSKEDLIYEVNVKGMLVSN